MAAGTVYALSLPVTNSGWANFTSRQTWTLAALVVPPSVQTQARVQFTAGSSGWDINAAYIGNKATSGDDYDFAATPTRLTFNNGSNTASLGANASLFSDWVLFTFDKVGNGLVISNYTAAATNDTQGQNNRPETQGNFFKAGNDASTVNATGYSSGLGTVGISAIEMNGFPEFGGIPIIGLSHVMRRVTVTGY